MIRIGDIMDKKEVYWEIPNKKEIKHLQEIMALRHKEKLENIKKFGFKPIDASPCGCPEFSGKRARYEITLDEIVYHLTESDIKIPQKIEDLKASHRYAEHAYNEIILELEDKIERLIDENKKLKEKLDE